MQVNIITSIIIEVDYVVGEIWGNTPGLTRVGVA